VAQIITAARSYLYVILHAQTYTDELSNQCFDTVG